MLQNAFQALQSGAPDRAEAISRDVLRSMPDDEGALLLLALSLDAQSRSLEALSIFERLTTLYPQSTEHWTNLGNVRRTLGYAAGAREAYEKAIELDSTNADARLNLGMLARDTGEFERAREHLMYAVSVNPEDPTARTQAANACYECGDTLEAERLLSGWDIWGRTDPIVLAEIGWIFARVGQADVASRALETAARLYPGHPYVEARQAAFLERVNRVDEARDLLARIDDRAMHSAGLAEDIAIVRAFVAARDEKTLEDACRLHEQLLGHPATEKRNPHLHFSLARLYDKRGDTKTAMHWLQRGHALQVKQVSAQVPRLFEPDADPLEITRYRVSSSDLDGWPMLKSPSMEESPIFVLGFPRSGTTMLETMLDAHPDLASMDERAFLQDVIADIRKLGLVYPEDLGKLDDAACRQLRDNYWHLVRTRARVATGKRLVDKNPLNMLRLPLLARLWPNAKIIVALRHPCDVVLSNYMQMFRSPAYVALCATLETTAKGYASAFDFWIDQAQLFKPDALELRYEDLVDDIGTHSRRLAEFLGIAWDERMVNFHDRARERGFISTPSYHQVVEPVNKKAVGRWQRYREWMEPALAPLRPFAERWNYEL